MIRIVHASDLHFGKKHDPGAATAFLLAARSARPDLIVLSGDFTQRAKPAEYQAAAEFIQRLPDVPIVVTPGNHDIPLYRVAERMMAPYRNYKAHIREELDTVEHLPGLTVVSLNSTTPYLAIVNGRIRDEQLAFARAAFGAAPEGDLRVVVAHHHLAPAPDYERDRPLPGGRRILEAFQEMGVDMVMGGHIHRAFIGNSHDVYAGGDRARGIVIVQSGTTTSRRGRARERAKNSFNLVTVAPDRLEVIHHMHFEGAGGFAPFSAHTFPRWPRRWFETEARARPPAVEPRGTVEERA